MGQEPSRNRYLLDKGEVVQGLKEAAVRFQSGIFAGRWRWGANVCGKNKKIGHRWLDLRSGHLSLKVLYMRANEGDLALVGWEKPCFN